MNRLKDEYGVQITMPGNDSRSEEIVVEGPKEGVRAACTEIKTLADRLVCLFFFSC